MIHQWDEFSKLLAEPVPRRESLRRFGVVLAGAVLSPLGTAWAAAKRRGKIATGKASCQTFCKCRNKRQQDACLAACLACGGDTRRISGACGSYFCCGNGQISCGDYCANIARDVYNCGACGHVCMPPGPNELVACNNGRCIYQCLQEAVRCNGTCTFLNSDHDNCGACGHVCPTSAPYCNQGVCFDPGCAPGLSWCPQGCLDLMNDTYNCGACEHQCAPAEFCAGGFCQGIGGGDWGY
jgi:hypothetical protein